MANGASHRSFSPPPRSVPANLRWRLLTNNVVVGGSVVFGASSLVALFLAHSSNPVAAWRLSVRHETASGWVQRVERTDYSENDRSIYRYEYAFRTPDGQEYRGSSFGKTRAPWLGNAARGPDGKRQVTIEYSPNDPDVSRILGMQTGPFTVVPLLVSLVIPVGSVAVIIYGLIRGRRQILLLQYGEAAEATITECLVSEGSDESSEWADFHDFRQRWQTPLLGPGTKAFIGMWRAAGLVMYSLAVLFCVVMLISVLFDFPVPLQAPRHQRVATSGMIAGFLLVWTGVFWAMNWGTGQMSQLDSQGATRSDSPELLRCRFRFKTTAGESVEAEDGITFSSRLLDEATESVLYDPAEPSRALLIDELPFPVRLTRNGEWRAASHGRLLQRVVAVAIGLLGIPLVGLMALLMART